MGPLDQYEENGKIYISAISKDMYDDFSFPVLQMDKVEAQKTSPQKKVSNNATTPKVTSEVSVDACEIVVPAKKIKRLMMLIRYLQNGRMKRKLIFLLR